MNLVQKIKKMKHQTYAILFGLLFIIVLLVLCLTLFMQNVRKRNLEENANYEEYRIVLKEGTENKKYYLGTIQGIPYYGQGIKQVYFQFKGVTLTLEETFTKKYFTIQRLLKESVISDTYLDGKIIVYENSKNRYNKSFYKLIQYNDFYGISEYVFLMNS